MKPVIAIVLFTLAIAANAATIDPPSTTQASTITPTIKPSTGPTTQTPTPTTNNATTTSKAATTSNVTTVDTTTVNPNTTTAAETTVAPNTTHTADVTTQSTTLKPVTTLKPDNSVKMMVTDGNNVCILVDSTFKFTFSYKDDSNKTRKVSMYLPKDVHYNGTCNGTQTLMAYFDKTNVFTMTFGKDKDMTSIDNMTLLFTMTQGTFPGLTKPREDLRVSNSKTGFSGSSGIPFMCKSEVNNTLEGSEAELTVTLTTTNLEFDAYRKSNTTEFGDKYTNCPQDAHTSDIVPIAVGAALAALVVIVLIAYLISRNRTKRGYESV